MEKFAFIGHFLGTEHFCKLIGPAGKLVAKLPNGLQKRLIQHLWAYMFLKFKVISRTGQSALGYGIIAPILPEQIVTIGEGQVIDKVVESARLAERMGAKIVGLAGFTSVVGNEGELVRKRVNIAVTSGNTLTAALALKGIRKAANLLGINMQLSTVAVIGATGDVGSICTRILAREVSRINIAARNVPRLNEFASEIQRDTGCPIQVKKYIREAVQAADIVLTATSAVTTLIESSDVKVGAIVCDVAIPHNVGQDLTEKRRDVLVFEGGMAKLPNDILPGNRRWRYISPDGVTIFGCLAETIVLALEGKWEDYSLGRGNITPEKIAEIESIASKHGLELADFSYAGKRFTESDISAIKRAAEQARN